MPSASVAIAVIAKAGFFRNSLAAKARSVTKTRACNLLGVRPGRTEGQTRSDPNDRTRADYVGWQSKAGRVSAKGMPKRTTKIGGI